MTNTANNTTVNTTAIDEAAEHYAEYLESFTMPSFDGSLATSYAEAQRIRDSYARWLYRKLDEIERGYQDLLKQLSETRNEEDRFYLEMAIEEYAIDNDTEYLVSELERIQSADDSGVNIWNTRPEVGDIEWGILADAPRWFDEGWTVPREVEGRPNPERANTRPANDCADDSICITPEDVKNWQETAPQLCWTDEVTFEGEDKEKAKAQAHQFIIKMMQNWKTKGDHDVEVLWTKNTWTFETKEEAQAFVNLVRNTRNRKAAVHACLTPKKSESGMFEAEVSWPMVQNGAGFKVATLKADGNWGSWDNYGHRRMRAHARDCYVQELLERVENADANQLKAIRREAGRASRDNQVLTFDKKVGRPAHTHDGGQVIKTKDGFRHTGRKVGIGLNFERYATVMNAAAIRAKELGLTGFRTYKVDEYAKTERAQKDGDMLDNGCMVGEFVALEMDSGERLDESLWTLQEKTWKPSKSGLKRLKAAGPTGFVSRSWEEILSDADSDWCMTQCGSLAA